MALQRINACYVVPTATIFLQNVCCACMFRSVWASKNVTLALQSVALLVLKGAVKLEPGERSATVCRFGKNAAGLSFFVTGS